MLTAEHHPLNAPMPHRSAQIVLVMLQQLQFCSGSNLEMCLVCFHVRAAACVRSPRPRLMRYYYCCCCCCFLFGLARQGPVLLTFEDDLEATELVVSQVNSFRKSATNTVLKPSDLFTVISYVPNTVLLFMAHILLKHNCQFCFLLQSHHPVATRQTYSFLIVYPHY